MRLTPFILVIIGILGLIYPEKFIAEDSGGGRWIFIIIILLGVITMWRHIQRMKNK
ncbi:hypothetical protein [Bartonella sp. LJL80]